MNQLPQDLLIDKLRELGVKLCFVYDNDLRPRMFNKIPDDLGFMGVGFYKKNSGYSMIIWLLRNDSYIFQTKNILDKFIIPYFNPAREGVLNKLSELLKEA